MKRIGNEISLEQIDEFFTIGKKVSNVRSVPRSCARPQKAKNLIHCNPDLKQPKEREPEYVPTYKRFVMSIFMSKYNLHHVLVSRNQVSEIT